MYRSVWRLQKMNMRVVKKPHCRLMGEERKKKTEWQRKVCKYLFAIMSNSIFPSASLLSWAIMESVFAWWQANRPALFRLVSAIMKKHHQPWMKAWHSVFHDTRQIITIDCYLGTAKDDRGRRSKAWWTGRARKGIKSQFSPAAVVFVCMFHLLTPQELRWISTQYKTKDVTSLPDWLCSEVQNLNFMILS